jgi:adenylate cyclase class IV
MTKKAKQMKKCIELRFFLDSSSAKKLMKHWKEQGFKTKTYSFVDFYFKHEKSGRKMVKVRKWRHPNFPTEAIFFSRKNGVKSEERQRFSSVQKAADYLEDQGYEKYITVDKKKVLIFSKGSKSYVLEFIKNLGWTGEIEIPLTKREMVKQEIAEIKSIISSSSNVKGSSSISFSLSPILELIEQKMGLKQHKKPKIYRYQLLKL